MSSISFFYIKFHFASMARSFKVSSTMSMFWTIHLIKIIIINIMPCFWVRVFVPFTKENWLQFFCVYFSSLFRLIQIPCFAQDFTKGTILLWINNPLNDITLESHTINMNEYYQQQKGLQQTLSSLCVSSCIVQYIMGYYYII